MSHILILVECPYGECTVSSQYEVRSTGNCDVRGTGLSIHNSDSVSVGRRYGKSLRILQQTTSWIEVDFVHAFENVLIPLFSVNINSMNAQDLVHFILIKKKTLLFLCHGMLQFQSRFNSKPNNIKYEHNTHWRWTQLLPEKELVLCYITMESKFQWCSIVSMSMIRDIYCGSCSKIANLIFAW